MLAALMLLRSARDRLSKEEITSELHLGFKEGAEILSARLQNFSNFWNKFMEEHRVFCITELHDNILMWSHYSDNHKGAVIQLRCIESLDNPICAASKVIYSDTFPSIIPTVQDFVQIQTGQRPMDTRDVYTRFVCTKSSQWQYEKEWRLIYPRDNTNKELYEMSRLWPQEIDAVYLGCKISDEDRIDILNLLTGELNHVRAYQASMDKRCYSLNFEQIK